MDVNVDADAYRPRRGGGRREGESRSQEIARVGLAWLAKNAAATHIIFEKQIYWMYIQYFICTIVAACEPMH
jgi:hypothetical protein